MGGDLMSLRTLASLMTGEHFLFLFLFFRNITAAAISAQHLDLSCLSLLVLELNRI